MFTFNMHSNYVIITFGKIHAHITPACGLNDFTAYLKECQSPASSV